MRLGKVRLEYLAPGGGRRVLEGPPPLRDPWVALDPLEPEGVAGTPGSPEEADLRVAAAEKGVRLLRLVAELEAVDLREKFLAKGLGSWSETRLLGPDDVLPGLRLAWFLAPYGDYPWVRYSARPGVFHSHWLTYTADRTGFTFLGSLNDHTAYTVFRVDLRRRRLWAEVDVEGLEPSPGDVLLRVFHAESDGGLLPLVRAYAARLGEVLAREEGLPRPLVPAPDHRPAGWNSWYNYYRNVSEDAVRAELDALRGLSLDYVQVDDGWQKEIGDWLEPGPRFRDLGRLAAAIREAGFVPGLWVAPLVATPKSSVSGRGWVKPWRAGWNASWGTSFRPLDLDRPEARDYVRRVGETLSRWGYGLVKADFLYAAAVRPWGGRTRATRMRQAMRLLREALPGRLLACGVPLASAVGCCDYARLGGDTTPYWEFRLLRFCRYRERPSTVAALRTVLGRWFMDGTLFVLDPDVFILGPGSLSPAERRTLYDVTTTVGGLVSFSDSLARLDPESLELVHRTFPLPSRRLLDVVEEERDLFRMTVEWEARAEADTARGTTRILSVNLGDEPRSGLGPHSSAWEAVP